MSKQGRLIFKGTPEQFAEESEKFFRERFKELRTVAIPVTLSDGSIKVEFHKAPVGFSYDEYKKKLTAELSNMN